MSRRVVWRPYWDYEREECWLNEMAAKGLEMRRYSWCRYEFDEGTPGRYVYRLQLLPKGASAPESREYLRFLEDAGVEVVDTYMSWVYLRKPTDSEPFELFTDRDSRLAHHKRVAAFSGSLAAAQIPLFYVTLTSVLRSASDNAYFGLPFLVPALALIVLSGSVGWRHYAEVRRLERDGAVHE